MSDLAPATLSFADIAKRTGKATPYWEKANLALTQHPACLTRRSVDESNYLLSPSVTHKCDNEKPRFAIAGLLNGKTLTPTRLLVINDDFSNLIEIQRYGDEPLRHFQTSDAVADSNIDAVLEKIASAVQREADKARTKREKTWDAVAKYAGGTVLFVLVGVVVIGLIALITWGLVSLNHAMGAADREANEKIAAFDQQYPDLVIQGKQFGIDSKDTLSSEAPDIAKDIPGTSYQSIGTHPRSFSVATGQCADSKDTSDKVGTINGDQQLVAQTNAPIGVIEIAIDKVGGVSVCAGDPEDLGGRGPTYTVLLQVQPKK